MSVFRDLLMIMPKESDLRHIRVGDVLYGKTLYFTFPDDYYLEIKNFYAQKGYSIIYPRDVFVCTAIPNNPISATGVDSEFNLLTGVNSYAYSNTLQYTSMQYNRSNAVGLFQSQDSETLIKLSSLNLTTVADIYQQVAKKPIAFIDTDNPAYKYIWVSKTEMGG